MNELQTVAHRNSARRWTGLAAGALLLAGLAALPSVHGTNAATDVASHRDPHHTTAAPSTDATVPGDTATTEPATTTSTVNRATTTTIAPVPTSVAPTTSTTAAPGCGPRPTALASGPGDRKAGFWIENTSALAGASVWVGPNGPALPDDPDPPHDVAPCETVGPFDITPQVLISGGQFGGDDVGVIQGQCGWDDNNFASVPDHQYVVVVYDERSIDSAACGVPDPPKSVLRARIFDLVTGDEVKIN